MSELQKDSSIIIDVNQLRFAYKKGCEDVLAIDQWQVRKGDKVFLYGASGSGKSTLLNLLSGTLVPSSGSIRLLSSPFSTLSARRRDQFRARHIGVVFQQFNLIPYLTVQKNIALAGYFAGNQASSMTQHMETLFQQLRLEPLILERPVSQLSVGQQQRVAIARALINQPEIMIVDEPTSALDSDARDGFMSMLMNTCDTNNTTLIFVSHDRGLARFFSTSQSIEQLQTRKEPV
jgi:putative ABC transport system ATP-binding protein